jgi:ATP-binding protein involved in chromosome partitioning
MAMEMNVPYLGSIPIEPEIVISGDTGAPIVKSKPDSETAKAFNGIVKILTSK